MGRVFVEELVCFFVFVSSVSGGVLDCVLSDNNYPELPRIKTGAEYTLDPKPTNPADVVPGSDKFGKRLQDGDKPWDDWNRCVGWNYTDAKVIFDLKKEYLIDKVELRLMERALPKELIIYCKGEDEKEFKEVARKEVVSGKGSFWFPVCFDYVRARFVRIDLKLKEWGFYLREVRIWGKLEEDDVSKVVNVEDADNKFIVVRGGKAYSCIVVADNPSKSSTSAGRLLQDFVKRMTGVVVPLATNSEAKKVKRKIYVGHEMGKINVEQRYPGKERFVVKRKGDRLIIVGNDKGNYCGTKMGVCALLEELGCRFYRYDKPAMYLIVPKRKELVIDKIDIDEKPVFPRREMWRPADRGYEEYAKLWWDWNRLGGIKLYTSHNEFIPRSEFKKHPEYFAMINGKRRCEGEWQYCTTNKDVIRLAAEAAARFFRKYPNYVSFSLSPRDCGGFCQCPECKKIDAEYGGNPSAKWVIFANAVREELDRRFPEYKDRYLVFYAYWYTKCAPTKLRLKKGVVAILVGDGCHVHFWNDRKCPGNRAIDAMLSAWQAISEEPVAIYDWYIPAISDKKWEKFPWVIYHKPINDQQYWWKRGVRWIQYETEHRMKYLPYRWITYYVLARGLWNPNQKPEVVLRDICNHLYGRSADLMFEIYRLMDEEMYRSKVHSRTWHLPNPRKIYTESVRKKIDEMFSEALEKSKGNKMDYLRVKDAVDVWKKGWEELERLSANEKKVKGGYNPNLKK